MNHEIQSFFESIADSVGLSKEDTKELVPSIPEKLEVSPVTISLKVEDEHPPISISAKGPIIEIHGDNATNKTKSLLYICNLLGYNFDEQENRKFLKHPELVEQGIDIFRKIKKGKKFELKIESSEYILSVKPTRYKSWIALDVSSKESGEKLFGDKYDLMIMRHNFQKSIEKYINVQFISKGRDFRRQVLHNISWNLKLISKRCHDRVEKLIRSERISQEIPDVLQFARQGPEERLESIKRELKEKSSELKEKGEQLSSKHGKLSFVNQLSSLIQENEGEDTFEKLKEAYELKRKIGRLEKRKPSEEVKRIKSELEKRENKLKEMKQRLLETGTAIEEIDDALHESLSKIQEESLEFNVERIIDALQGNQIDILLEELDESFGKENVKVIKDMAKTANRYDPSLAIPKFGTLKSLQETLKELVKSTKRKVFVNKTLAPLSNVIEKHEIGNQTEYREVISEKERLEEIVRSSKDEVRSLRKKKKELEGKPNQKELESINKKLEEYRARQSELKSQLGTDEAKDIHRDLNRLAKQIITEDEDPFSLVYSANWEHQLRGKKEEIEQEIREIQSDVKTLEDEIENLEKEYERIKNAKESGKIDRIQNLRDFRETLDSLIEVLSGDILLKRSRGAFDLETSEEDLLEDLRKYNVLDRLDKLINSIFSDRCRHYFLMTDEGCETKEITNFDYLEGRFGYGNGEEEILDPFYSGGTSSALTVTSLASIGTRAKMGNLLLVDETGDVGPSMRKEVCSCLRKNTNLAAALFVRLTKGPLKAVTV